MLPHDLLPDWWTSSELFAWLSGRGMHYWIAHWNHLFAAILVLASTRRMKGIQRRWTVRPAVLMWTLLAFQFIFGFLGFAALDSGMMYYGGSALWGVVAIWYATFMWALRRQARREKTTLPTAEPAVLRRHA